MGKEQDLLQAVKSGDLLSTQKLLSKLKTNRNSKYTRPNQRGPPSRQRSHLVLVTSVVSGGGWH